MFEMIGSWGADIQFVAVWYRQFPNGATFRGHVWQKIQLIAKKERKKKQETKQNPERQHA